MLKLNQLSKDVDKLINHYIGSDNRSKIAYFKQFKLYVNTNPSEEFITKQRDGLQLRMDKYRDEEKEIKDMQIKEIEHERKLIQDLKIRHDFSKINHQLKFCNYFFNWPFDYDWYAKRDVVV